MLANFIKALIFCLLTSHGQVQRPTGPKAVQWVKARVSSLYEYKKGEFIVGLGISAKAYYLQRKQKDQPKLLEHLSTSLKTNTIIAVGYVVDDRNRSLIVQIIK